LYEARQARSDFKRLMIVEGYMDVVRLHQAGITYAVATLGTATTQEHLNKIFRLTSELVFCFDGDRAGLRRPGARSRMRCRSRATGASSSSCSCPRGTIPTRWSRPKGRRVRGALKSALPLSEYLVQQLLEQVDLAHVDGRAKLAALAAPLFARMPDGVYRELLLDRLAPRSACRPRSSRSIWVSGRPRAARTPAHPNTRGTNSGGAQSDERGTRQFAEPGHHPGVAPPRRGARRRSGRPSSRVDLPGWRCSRSCSSKPPAWSNPAPRCCSSAGGIAPNMAA
jgi:DNA primase